MVGLTSGINVSYHVLVLLWGDLFRKDYAWKWNTFLSAGYNTTILLSLVFKGVQFLSWLLSYLDPALAWWFMSISQVNVLGDFTWHLIGIMLWMTAIGVDYVSVTGDFLWHFWVEWGLVIVMWIIDMMTTGGLVDWYFYGVLGQTDENFCNVWHEDCDKKQDFLDKAKWKLMKDY